MSVGYQNTIFFRKENALYILDYRKVGDNMDEIKCYICGAVMKSKSALTRHINSSKELTHIQYKQHMDRLKDSYKDSSDYQLIGCNFCKCYECDPNNFALCLREEKKIYESVKKRYDKEEKRKQRLEVHANEAKKKRVRKDDANSPFSLLKEFYEGTNNTCVNYGMELAKIKRMLNYGVTPDCIRDAFKLMKSRGEQDLRYFGKYAIQEAVKIKQYTDDLSRDGSLSNLVKLYYDGTNTTFSMSLLAQGVDRLKRIKNEYKLDKDKLKYIVDYMITKKVKNFCFIDNNVAEALREWNASIEVKKDNINKNSNNYYLQSALEDIINGLVTVDETIQIYGMKYDENMSFPRKVCTLLEEDKYNNKYSAMEWAYKINFHFNKRTYFLAKEHTYKSTSFTGIERIKYIDWLREQKNKFES